MNEIKLPLRKCIFLTGVLLFYVLFGISIKILLIYGLVNLSLPNVFTNQNNWEASLIETPYRAEIAKSFVVEVMTRRNGHVNLIYPTNFREDATDTNSEAISYYLLWNALSHNRNTFDKEVNYVEDNMINPDKYYMMWRLNYNDTAVGDGVNIATDADLRTIKALYIARDQWDKKKYDNMINGLASSLEDIAITDDELFAPYGGVSDGTVWKANEIWLSYADFQAFALLAKNRGEKWNHVYNNMKKAILNSQLDNGLYRVQLDEDRKYNNKLDNDGYSINSLWIMVRASESNDPELMNSANKSLKFYKDKFESEGIIYTSYGSNGSALTDIESPWAYALIGRAALELDDKEFAEKMISKLLEFQVVDEKSVYFGAIVEGSQEDPFVSQFTMQESILTLEDYNEKSRLG